MVSKIVSRGFYPWPDRLDNKGPGRMAFLGNFLTPYVTLIFKTGFAGSE
jgi:hypothetical protein